MAQPLTIEDLRLLAKRRVPRILASRTVFVADDDGEAMQLADIGLNRHRARLTRLGRATGDGTLDAMIVGMDVHLGTPDKVIASLQTDTALARSTHVAVQVHSIDPPHPYILRSIELVAEVVAPALNWGRAATPAARFA